MTTTNVSAEPNANARPADLAEAIARATALAGRLYDRGAPLAPEERTALLGDYAEAEMHVCEFEGHADTLAAAEAERLARSRLGGRRGWGRVRARKEYAAAVEALEHQRHEEHEDNACCGRRMFGALGGEVEAVKSLARQGVARLRERRTDRFCEAAEALKTASAKAESGEAADLRALADAFEATADAADDLAESLGVFAESEALAARLRDQSAEGRRQARAERDAAARVAA
jgi:hypothetical protein